MVLTMRLAGYNANRVGTEPVNGQGIYSAASALVASWIVTAGMAGAATLALSWDLRQFVSQALSTTWNIWQLAAKSVSVTWDLRQFATKTVSTLWDVGSGVISTLRARWRVPFGKHLGTALTGSASTSALTRHTETSSLSER